MKTHVLLLYCIHAGDPLLQDITAALQPGSDDTEPISDAPNYEVG